MKKRVSIMPVFWNGRAVSSLIKTQNLIVVSVTCQLLAIYTAMYFFVHQVKTINVKTAVMWQLCTVMTARITTASSVLS